MWIFVDYLASATDEQVRAICDRLVPLSVDWTSTQLRTRLKRALLEIDPGWQHRRYRDAVTGRHLSRYLNDDGSATISGVGVPITEAMAACARVEALASAARTAGHPCTIGQLQVDVFVGLISGQWQHSTDEEILAALLERGTRPEDNPTPTDPAEPAESGEPAESAEPAESGEPAESAESTQPVEPGGRPAHPVRHEGWEMQVGLATLLGLDERVGVIAGWGAVPAPVARAIVGQRWRGQWRFVVLNSTGRMEFAGITRRRPHRSAEAIDPGGVELHLCAAQLRELVAHPDVGGPWRAIIEDINTHYQRFRVNPRAWLTRLDRNPGIRFIRNELARYVEIRDRHCTAPHCRRPARHCQLDHTFDYTLGGTSTHTNSGPVCGRHHYAKTHGWWTVTQPHSGQFIWTSPLKRAYATQGEPIRYDPIPTAARTTGDPPPF